MNLKIIVICSVALNVLFPVGIVLKRWYYSSRPTSDLTSYSIANNKLSTSIHDKLPIDTNSIVFVGNSITERFPVAEMFGSLNFKNRGIGSNETIQVAERLPAIMQRKPRMVFLEIGVNDLARNLPVDSIMHNFEAIVNLALKYDVTLYIFAVFPTYGDDAYLMPKIREVNSRLYKLCETNFTGFIDLTAALSKDGFLNPAYSYDGIHLNGEGMVKWRDAIEGYVCLEH